MIQRRVDQTVTRQKNVLHKPVVGFWRAILTTVAASDVESQSEAGESMAIAQTAAG